VGVEPAKARVELQACRPRIKPMKQMVYRMDKPGFQSMGEKPVYVVVIEEGAKGTSDGDIIEDEPKSIEKSIVEGIGPGPLFWM
jgi:hypothetical protein